MCDLKKLYEVSKEFCSLKPWTWLRATDIFGIKFEGIDETIFCSVLGMDEETYGMIVYKGIKQLESFFRLLNGDFDCMEEKVLEQNWTAVYFRNRSDLKNQDYDLVVVSEVKFRGKNQWPQFRVFEPGFIPHTLEGYEISFMTKVIEAAKDEVIYYKDHRDKLELLRDANFCIRKVSKSGDRAEKILSYEDYFNKEIQEDVSIFYNELDVKRILKNSKIVNTTWEIDRFFSFIPIDDDEEPFYPAILMIVDDSGYIVGNHTCHPLDTAKEFQQYIIEFLQSAKSIPRKVYISNPNLLYDIGSLLEDLGIQIEVKQNLDFISEIKRGYYDQQNNLDD